VIWGDAWMAARENEVATAIETEIRDSIEKMVADIRSSIDDVREAVNQQLKAAQQSVEADANTSTLRPAIERALAEFQSSLQPAAAAAPPEPVVHLRPDASRIKRAVAAVEQGRSQVDILNGLLEQALNFGSRAALLILKGESFAGWKGAGFGQHGGDDEQIKRFAAAPGTVSELDQMLRQERVVTWDGRNLAARFSVSEPDRAVLVPMVIKDKIAAALYLDQLGGEDADFDTAAIELLVFTTGLLIDTLAIRRKTPSPSLTDAEVAPETTPAAARPAAFDDTKVSIPVTPPAQAAPPRPPTPPSQVSAPEPPRAEPPRPEPPPPAAPPPEPQAPRLDTQSALRPPAAAGAEPGEKPSTQYIPPPGVQRRFGSNEPQTEEGKKHDEARRFARLLVSEIKLYNEPKVEQGRRNRDLYERLREDIDRSRQMYDERIAEEVRRSSNYFYDELVRILADGKADVLGL
jgi:hypothetical protein